MRLKLVFNINTYGDLSRFLTLRYNLSNWDFLSVISYLSRTYWYIPFNAAPAPPYKAVADLPSLVAAVAATVAVAVAFGELELTQ